MQKARPSTLVRLRALDAERQRLLVHALATVSLASAAVAILPFRHAIRFGSSGSRRSAPLSIDDCVWAVRAAARRLPWRAKCIEQGLAAQRMLRRAGVDAVLHYGARHERGAGKLQAHVWVTVGGNPVIGGEEADNFAEVASYP